MRKQEAVSAQRFGRPPPADDPYFFHKGQITLGTVIEYGGRTDPGSLWEVVRIVSRFPPTPNRAKNGDWAPREVEVCRRMDDDVYMRRISEGRGSKRKRTATFAYISYCVLYRISDALHTQH